jgi:hypothetical protein
MNRLLTRFINERNYSHWINTCALLTVYTSSRVLMNLWPDVCWLPRMGGVLVGVAVVIQGYMAARTEQFNEPWRWGIPQRVVYTHFSSWAAAMGTIFWTFGDFFPDVLGLSNAACKPPVWG